MGQIKAMTLDAILKAVEKVQGIDIKNDPSGMNYVIGPVDGLAYDIIILDGNTCQVRVEGGNYFTEPTVCQLNGATFGGSMLKIGWIGLAMCVEFVHNGNTITTDFVNSIGIKINGVVCQPPSNSVN